MKLRSPKRGRCHRWFQFFLGCCFLQGAAAQTAAPKRIVLIAGAKSHPAGAHEYLKSVKLLKVLLDRANLHGIETEIHFNGWPDDPRVLERADTIAWFSDGENPAFAYEAPYLRPERLSLLQQQIDRGCGWFAHHYSVFSPVAHGPRILEWSGAYFDFETGRGEGGLYGAQNLGDRARYHSLIRVDEADVHLVSAQHPVGNGVRPFRIRDEFYYQLVFGNQALRIQAVLRVPAFSENASAQTIAWAYERDTGGRSFGITLGHRFANWTNDDYRRIVLNALIWTAGGVVPPGGVQSTYIDENEVDQALLTRPIRTMLWLPSSSSTDGEAQTEVFRAALNSEWPRFVLASNHDAPPDLSDYRLLLVDQRDLELWGSDAARRHRLEEFLASGGGLVIFTRGPTPGAVAGPAPVVEPWGRPIVWESLSPISVSPANRTETWYHVSLAAQDATRRIAEFRIRRDDVALGLAPDNRLSVQKGAGLQVIASAGDVPLAFAVPHGKGRVFQLLLGGGFPASGLNPRIVQLLRGGALWAAHDQ
jgi:type 1 glutamine amidotransferase